MHRGNGHKILSSWRRNAELWKQAVQTDAIPSRRAGTSEAILSIVGSLNPQRLLDVGCGEGWLVRQVSTVTGCVGLGFDGLASLVDFASQQDRLNAYLHLSYEDFTRFPGQIPNGFDVAVCNYSLFDESVDSLLIAVRSRLSANGRIVIQTLHPFSSSRGEYADGWRNENFTGFGFASWTPMPWYFRTLASWIGVISASGFSVQSIHEPTAEGAPLPLSLILVAAKSDAAPI